MRTRPQDSQGAFTLVELLVAAALTAVLAGIMFGITRSALELWRRAQEGFAADTEAGFVLDFIERDVQGAVFRADGQTWLAVDVINSPTLLVNHGWLTTDVIKPGASESRRYLPTAVAGGGATIAEARFGLSGAWLRFITTNVESGGSLPVAVAYQIARRPVSGEVSATNRAAVRYTLFRSAVDQNTTLATGTDVLAAGYASSAASPQETGKASTLSNPGKVDAIASNVVDFGVWLYVRDAGGSLRKIFPADENDETYRAVSVEPFPEVIDVMVRVLTEKGARLIAAIESGRGGVERPNAAMTDEAWWWSVAEAHSRVFTRRIEVKGGAR